MFSPPRIITSLANVHVSSNAADGVRTLMLTSVNDVHEPVVVQVAEVPASEPPVLRYGLSGGLGVPVVFFQHVGSTTTTGVLGH